jgi:hypothetical protein
VAVACGAVLSLWNAELLAGALEYVSVRIDPFWSVVLGALPCALVLADVWWRRRRTPRFKPSLDDDPVLRRYVAEKIRRARLRRQAEELQAASDDFEAS